MGSDKTVINSEPGLNINNNVLTRYAISSLSLDKTTGKLNFPDQTSLQQVTAEINKIRQQNDSQEKSISAAEFNALLMLSEIYCLVISLYANENTGSFPGLNSELHSKIGSDKVAELVNNFRENYSVKLPESEITPGSLKFYQELIILWLHNNNPALKIYRDFVNDQPMTESTKYPQSIKIINDYFEKMPSLPGKNISLISFLRLPALLNPHSVQAQLEYIRDNWSDLLGDFLERLLRTLDLVKEENKAHFTGPGPAYTYEFDREQQEYEKFTKDSEWMPRTVILAKSTYVWLDQLTKKYGYPIEHLDQIPDNELSIIARRGFTAIWLIGLWERSTASRKIKQIMGDQEAIASAYSLFDYQIAASLGGDQAMGNLQYRAWNYGLRIACDMVPNHMGIDSKWVFEHPDWFLQLPHPPYPAYSFTGENMSQREDVTIRIEDHYYTRNDAAVVFQYHNNHSGETRYIYHGNDGTSIPWNDTAQLNFLLPEVREAVTQMIIQIAKRFPIIRFDAAMTLARKHIQRLWFPEPGQGGDIPSRAEHGLTKAEFNRLMPEEFWRTVVDRIEQEAPHTLLLAEAFWMMEGYFVRTLGMHRVYNSAFMNMLKNEDNAAYRQSIFNILEFNPQILKRFVNFMSNPDEETAIAQFGNDDKYFGVCVLMCTMPGLPMFAHGQIEGFQERYGMEFLRARWEEQENQYLINRHQQEIFPLLKKRYLFAEVDNFLLFDFQTDHNGLNENVFAYLNKFRDETALVIYNNKYDRTSGRIYQTDYLENQSSGSNRIVKKLATALNLHNSPDHYLIFRDVISGLFHISSCSELHHHGLRQTLDGFKYRVYLDFVEVVDNQDRNYSELHLFLQGSGVQNIDRSIMQIRLKNTLNQLDELSSHRLIKHFVHMIEQGAITTRFFEEMAIRLEDFFSTFQQEFNPETDSKIALTNALDKIRNWNFNSQTKISEDQKSVILSLIWIILSSLKNLIPNDVSRKDDFSWIEDLNFSQKIFTNLQPWFENINETRFNALLQICLKCDDIFSEDFGEKIIDLLTNDSEVQIFLKINEYNKILWFDDQAFDLLWHCLLQISLINLSTDEKPESKSNNKVIAGFKKNMLTLLKAKQMSEFKVENLIREITAHFMISD